MPQTVKYLTTEEAFELNQAGPLIRADIVRMCEAITEDAAHLRLFLIEPRYLYNRLNNGRFDRIMRANGIEWAKARLTAIRIRYGDNMLVDIWTGE